MTDAIKDRHGLAAIRECTFPGSPVDLRHFFTLAGKKITRLEIIP